MSEKETEESISSSSSNVSLPDPDDADESLFYDDIDIGIDISYEEEETLEEEGMGTGILEDPKSPPRNHEVEDHGNDSDNNDGNNGESNIIMDGRMSPKKQRKNDNSSTTENSSSHVENDDQEVQEEMMFSEYILGTLIVRVVCARDLKHVKQSKQRGSMVGSLRDAIFNSPNKDSSHNNNPTKPKARRMSTSKQSTFTSSASRSRSGSYDSNHHHQHQTTTNRYQQQNVRSQRNDSRRNHAKNKKSANPYATITFANQTERTSTVYDTTHPSFPRNEQAYFDVSLPIHHLAHEDENEIEERNQRLSEDSKASLSSLPLPPPPPQPPILRISIKHDDHDVNDYDFDEGDDYNYDYGKKISMNKSHLKKPSTPRKPKNTSLTNHGNSDDDGRYGGDINNPLHFLGTTSIDVTHLITGKVTYIDEWLTLHPEPSSSNTTNATSEKKSDEQEKDNIITGQVRIICEYDMTDITPRIGDLVRFNGFVKPMDVFPIPASQIFRVDNIGGEEIGGADIGNINLEDILVLSYKSNPEGWYCTFIAHRFMFLSVERHVTAVERYHDEMIHFVSKIASSPAIHVVQNSLSRLPEEGILFMGLEASLAGLGLAGRWFKGGVGTIVDDIVYATNLDGKSSIKVDQEEEENEQEGEEDLSIGSSEENADDELSSLQHVDDDLSLDIDDIDEDSSDNDEDEDSITEDRENASKEVINKSKLVQKVSKSPSKPFMPCCPITGQPMKEPVVAADGHTYEKKAISKWYRTSNMSPLTGKELPHKELVPNYLLISTFQDDKV